MAPGLTESSLQKYLQKKASTAASQSKGKDYEAMVAHLKKIPILTPAEMDALIGEHGYVGQEHARKTICLAAYSHIQRLKRIYLEGIKPCDLPTRENILCYGSTGMGKTFLLTILFDKILKLPSVTVDATRFSETGYVGDKVEWALTRLLYAAQGNVQLAQIGACIWDEFDKLTGGISSAAFGGAGTTKDVSGFGVQRGLLKLVEGAVVDVPPEIGDYSCRKGIRFDTSQTLFVGCGAFSGMDILKKWKRAIGFGSERCSGFNGSTGSSKNYSTPISPPAANDFVRYGLMAELVGRFGLVVGFEKLSKEQLTAILEHNVIHQYRRELELEGIELIIDEDVPAILISRCVSNGTGARSLSSAMVSVLGEGCYQVYSTKGLNRQLRLFVDHGEICWEILKARMVKYEKEPQEHSVVGSRPVFCI